jgi:hypothetical protein
LKPFHRGRELLVALAVCAGLTKGLRMFIAAAETTAVLIK